MGMTFLQGTKVILEDSTNTGYEFLVSSISLDQTYIEASRDIRTLHNKNLIKDTFIKEKSNTTFSLKTNFTSTDTIFFDWLDCTESSGEYKVPVSKDSLLSTADFMNIYIDSGTTIFKITNCVIESMTFGLEKGTALTINITGSGQDRTEIANLPSFSTYVTQGTPFTGSLIANINSTNVSNIAGVTCEITRNIQWLNQATVHTGISGSLYQKTQPIILDTSITGQITINKHDNSLTTITNTPLEIIYNNSFTISLDSCNFTDRWVVGPVFKKVTEYKLLPTATNPFIKF